MNALHIVLYGFFQGMFEFLPISSSAHLLLLEKLLGLEKTPATLEAAINLGSVLALTVYFGRFVWKIIQGFFHLVYDKKTDESRLFTNLFLASLPAVFVGFLLHMTDTRPLIQTVPIAAWSTVTFGLILLIADKRCQRYTLADISRTQAFFGWGLAQCLAFISGVSRSGILITCGRALGYQRKEAVLFAFLMAIPSLKGAFILLSWSWFQGHIQETQAMAGGDVLLAVFTSMITGLFTLRFFLKGLEKDWLQNIALYRIALGLVLLGSFYVWSDIF